MKRYLLVHYGEIGLKRSHETYFAKKLKDFLRNKLQERFRLPFRLIETLGRLLIPLPEGFVESEYSEIIHEVFGVQNYAFVWAGSIDVDELSQQIFNNLPELDVDASFCVRVKRSQLHTYGSSEAEREIGAQLLRAGIDRKVKMKNPSLQIEVEFFNDTGFFFFKKHDGPGGLPINTSGKLLSLISAGFDSPVASYRMMRRGARVSFVHFHSYPYSDKEEQDQVKELVKLLSRFQFDTRLFLLPFGKVQKDIASRSEVPASYRTVVYRRMMMRIASRLAVKEKARGLITGDNLGQVASQTLENLFAVNEVLDIPLYQPLISFDKEHIIAEAEKIGTAEVSSRPCKDTCVMFSPRKPEVRSSVYDLREYEKDLPIEDYIQEVLSGAELIEI